MAKMIRDWSIVTIPSASNDCVLFAALSPREENESMAHFVKRQHKEGRIFMLRGIRPLPDAPEKGDTDGGG